MLYIPIFLGMPIPLGIRLFGNMTDEMTGKSIKQLFQKLDDRDFLILYLFRRGPATRYQILMRTKLPEGKNPQIPRNTVYRRINEKLVPLGFLEEIARESFEKGSLRHDKPVYIPTLKGIVASLVYENLPLGDLEGWFRWLLQFNMDLSGVNVGPKFYIWTVLYACGDHPEWFPPKLRTVGEKMKKDFEGPNKITMEIFKEGFIKSYEEQKKGKHSKKR